MRRNRLGNFDLEEYRYLTPVNLTIVAINVVVYLVLEIIGDTQDAWFMFNHGATYADAVLSGGQWYRLLTAAFLHFGLPHLINNMVLLVCLGSYLERAYGKVRYAIFYLICAISANFISMMYNVRTSQSDAVSAGASGAIFGVIGALLFLVVKNKGRFADLTWRRFLLMMALSLYYGFSTAGVDNAAHIGGLVVGFVMGAFYWGIGKLWGLIRRV